MSLPHPGAVGDVPTGAADRPRHRAGGAGPGPVAGPAPAERIRRLEDRLRGRLGLRPLGAVIEPAARLWGWLGPLAVTALAAVLRLVNLDHPGRG
ncbi:MAG: phospholipid carrier-dependent glycosyltransferase, partial [Georgenia sp.]